MYLSQYEYGVIAVKNEDFEKLVNLAIANGISVVTSDTEDTGTLSALQELTSDKYNEVYYQSSYQESSC